MIMLKEKIPIQKATQEMPLHLHAALALWQNNIIFVTSFKRLTFWSQQYQSCMIQLQNCTVSNLCVRIHWCNDDASWVNTFWFQILIHLHHPLWAPILLLFKSCALTSFIYMIIWTLANGMHHSVYNYVWQYENWQVLSNVNIGKFHLPFDRRPALSRVDAAFHDLCSLV